MVSGKASRNLMKGNQKHLNERMAKRVANKNMNEIEATQKIIELAQEKQKKAKHELGTVHKEKQKITNELEEKVVKKEKKKK